MARTRQFFSILTYTCATRHSGVPFFRIATSKSAPNMRCFVHFHLQMCFSLQRRAIFRHRNFKKMLRSWRVLYILTWKCASRHSRVPFFISLLNSYLRGYFSNIRNHESLKKHSDSRRPQHFAHVYLLSTDSTRVLIFFLLTWLLCHSAFQLSILSEVRLLNFLRLILYIYIYIRHTEIFCLNPATTVRFGYTMLLYALGTRYLSKN